MKEEKGPIVHKGAKSAKQLPNAAGKKKKSYRQKVNKLPYDKIGQEGLLKNKRLDQEIQIESRSKVSNRKTLEGRNCWRKDIWTRCRERERKSDCKTAKGRN